MIEREKGDLQLGNLEKKQGDLNKNSGINTNTGIFNTQSKSSTSNYFAPEESGLHMNRVEELANYGTIGQNRSLIQNSADVAMPRMKTTEKTSARSDGQTKVRSEENRGVIKARSDLKVFSGDVMKKGVFTPKAKEAGRHFFGQVMKWAGSFDDGGKTVYRSMGISSVLDCLYVDGMSLKAFVKEQYYYKGSANPTQEKEVLQNYLALIAARGSHVITLARPNVKGNRAEVEFKNLEMDLSEVGSQEAERAKRLKERGNQVRSTLKKRLENELTERTGMALRQSRGMEMDGFNRLEGAGAGLKAVGENGSDGYVSFRKKFDRYNGGLQKLGLKPDRDDINAAVAGELMKRCEEAIEAADDLLGSDGIKDEETEAVKKARAELETDRQLYEKALERKLSDEGATMSLKELLDSTADTDNKGDTSDTDSDNEE